MKFATLLIASISTFSSFAQCNLTLSSSTTMSTCANYDGSATVTPSNGTSPYTYDWEHFENGSVGSSQTLSNAQAGVYFATVTDSQGCIAIDTVQITSSDGPVIALIGQSDASCFGLADGYAEVEFLSPQDYGGYWTNSATTYATNQLTAGFHVFTGFNTSGCINHATVIISQPEDVPAPTGDATQVLCGAGPFTLDDFNVNGTDIVWLDSVSFWVEVLPGTTPVQLDSVYYCVQTINGCQSYVQLSVTATSFAQSSSAQITHDACIEYYWPLSGMNYTTSGIYTATIENAAGCDSVIDLDLTIQSLDVSTSVTDFTISATATGMQYQWIDCSNNMPINGETNQSFTATTNGNYAVIVDNGNCSDTSECVAISTIGLEETPNSNIIRVYPNPTKGTINIDFGTAQEKVMVNVHSLSGQITQSATSENVSEINLTLDCSPGIYILEIQDDSKRIVRMPVILE